MEYSLKYIHHRLKDNIEEFIGECEQNYQRQVNFVAEKIADSSRQKPIVLLNGPSSSGKTTTCDRLYRALSRHGIHAKMVSMDDYYRSHGTYDVPEDPENHVPDLECPECMNLPLLSRHLAALVAGEEISMPRFDFSVRLSIPNAQTLRLNADEVILIEGIHAFNPVIMGDLAHSATGVYLSIASTVQPEVGTRMETYMLRFLRRAMRDSLFRSTEVKDTLRQWLSVRRGERLYIGPYRGQADYTIDTFLPYELNVLTEHLRPQLENLGDRLQEADLEPVVEILPQVMAIPYTDYIPENSVLHEFIG